MSWTPDITVAAIVERDGRFLLVEEIAAGRRVLNQPAGHVEDGESPLDAVVREAREETAWSFQPEALIGVYLWSAAEQGPSFLRFAYSGRCVEQDSSQSLDAGIVRTLWLTREEIAARSSALRSPMVLRCIDDYQRGRRAPLSLVSALATGIPISDD